MNRPVNIEQNTLNNILVWVAQLGDNIQNTSEKVQKIQEQTGVFRKITDRELEAMLSTGAPRTVSMLENNAFIYLPPAKKGDCFVPILCVEYDYAIEMPKLSLKIALFHISENDDKRPLQAIGYRFETSHEQERHHYCHIQHINGFGHSDRYKLPGTEWVPMEYPAFPIDAQNPIELLVCLLVSLYDLDIINDLKGEFKTLIEAHIKKMRLFKFVTKI